MKVYLDTIGCRLNQSEIEQFARQFRSAGHEIVDSAGKADVVVVNTCTVTSQAASDSRQKIRQAARAGKAEILVTGCWSTLEPQAALALPGVRRLVPNDDKDHLVSGYLNLPEERFDLEPLAREPLPGLHLRTRAFLKVQDGCDNHCTYCITRIARGAGRSVPVSQVIAEVQAAQEGGVNEVVLSGVHLGSWGSDFPKPVHLYHLIEAILKETDVPRLRLSSLEPWDLHEEFFGLWENPRMCRHLHLPLQSGSAATLQRMARKTTPESFSRLVELARRAAPEMAITTDLIAGFPGETGPEFEEGLRFVEQMQFAGGHVFAYSERPGTPAVRLPNAVPYAERRERGARLREAIARSNLAFRKNQLGKEVTVLWESTDSTGPQGWRLHGLTDHYLKVRAYSPERLWNRFDRVRLTELTEDGLLGVIQE
ncbi:radical SAM methylthiotransferase, MiaB/RimO family [Longilinea arvoryzae]|uniref:Radical SAM methylthiotransferase, MiaB/RimO family n=1 Tax=Longilinea arvoryzae TaxID=360412 RepID=A0A0S7BBV0_9CHLR|nr:MiaB/RimO family radical SAM methylthiotransferase [Longilinea arvoryzae]GAP15166.1 radical SAM methylthiotransferase, MiaB/RimO family [Longilinea arvoryzae]